METVVNLLQEVFDYFQTFLLLTMVKSDDRQLPGLHRRNCSGAVWVFVVVKDAVIALHQLTENFQQKYTSVYCFKKWFRSHYSCTPRTRKLQKKIGQIVYLFRLVRLVRPTCSDLPQRDSLTKDCSWSYINKVAVKLTFFWFDHSNWH